MDPLVLISRLVGAFVVYAGIGLVFAVAFLLRGAARLDPNADGATWGFKALILPGTVALWPLLLVRWMRAPSSNLLGNPPEERSPHRVKARERA